MPQQLFMNMDVTFTSFLLFSVAKIGLSGWSHATVKSTEISYLKFLRYFGWTFSAPVNFLESASLKIASVFFYME